MSPFSALEVETLQIFRDRVCMLGWRNWQTRTVEGRVEKSVWVRLPLRVLAELYSSAFFMPKTELNLPYILQVLKSLEFKIFAIKANHLGVNYAC